MSRAYESAMDEDTPRPPTTKRNNYRGTRSDTSSASYPHIPRRSSSLYMSSGNSSDDLPTSTRTPSFSSSSYNIEVQKRRINYQAYSRGTGGSIRGSVEDPFSDAMIPQTPTKLQMRDQKFRRRNSPHLLTVRWSSGSFNSSIPGLTSSLPDSPIRTNPSSNLTNFQGESQSWENSQHFCPMDLPIAFVGLQASTVRPQIGFDRECVTTTINISADIGSVPLPEPSSLAPLDIIILLGFLPEISDNSLNQFTLGSIILTSHTIRGQDRIALGYVSGEATSQFQLILPLGFHSVDDIRAALNTFARRSRLSRQKTPDLEVAIRESSRIFSSSPRIAYCHSFFVSPIPPANCSVPWIDPAIGFHTITPQKFLGLSHMNHQSGWHIFYDIDTEDGSKPQFTKNVANVLRHIRTGLRPGYIDQIKVVLTPGPGCKIQPVKRMHQISSLRPGEIWSLPVNVIVPVALQEEDRDEVHKLPQIALEAIVGINKFLMGWVNDLPEQILTVHVDYRHSLLPSGSTVNLQTHVTSLRSRHTSDNSKPGLWKASRSLFNLAKSSC